MTTILKLQKWVLQEWILKEWTSEKYEQTYLQKMQIQYDRYLRKPLKSPQNDKTIVWITHMSLMN